MKQSSKDTDEMDNEDNEDLFPELGGITLSKCNEVFILRPLKIQTCKTSMLSKLELARLYIEGTARCSHYRYRYITLSKWKEAHVLV
jgi:hypothetical protein